MVQFLIKLQTCIQIVIYFHTRASINYEFQINISEKDGAEKFRKRNSSLVDNTTGTFR